jgi:hypothetical protein
LTWLPSSDGDTDRCEDASAAELTRCRRLTDLRRELFEVFAEEGVLPSRRAVEQFVARQKDKTPGEFAESVQRYRRRRTLTSARAEERTA